MSLNGALWLNGTTMAAQAKALGTIADNIANLNTGGYRKRTVSFSDMLGHPDKFLARSVATKANVTTRVETGGAYAMSDNGLDAAFGGRALFPVAKDVGGADRYYTRNGAFGLQADPGGTMRLATNDGYYLMGWPVDATGVVSQSLQTITVPDRTSVLPAVASTSGALADNLPASAAVGQQVIRSIPVYDTTGTLHSLDLTFTNTAPNAWDITASSSTGAVALATSPLPLAFDGSTGNVTGTSSIGLSGTWSNGATATIALDFSAMTQWGEQGAVRAAQVDGSPSGYVSSYFFDNDGFLNVSYSNSAVRAIYQVPGAVFRNANGLTEHSGDVFRESVDSGAATLIDPQSSGLGSFRAATLELSNVDLATEMTNLIQTQRAYSTAATAFRTIDEMITTARDLR